MNRYADREYYAALGELPENGGMYRIDRIHWYEKQDENRIACNTPKQERGR